MALEYAIIYTKNSLKTLKEAIVNILRVACKIKEMIDNCINIEVSEYKYYLQGKAFLFYNTLYSNNKRSYIT